MVKYPPVSSHTHEPLVHGEEEMQGVGAGERRQVHRGARATVTGQNHHPEIQVRHPEAEPSP